MTATGQRLGRGLAVAAILVGLLLSARTAALAGPVWVVDPCNLGCWRIDPVTEQVTGFVDLSDGDPGSAPAPAGVAFSTIPGEGARWAFVTQGSLVRIVRVSDGIVTRTVDLGAQLGLAGLRLERLDGAPARWAKTPSGDWHWEVALWIVGTREDGGHRDPWFFVLDQEALVEGSPFYLLGHDRMCPPDDPACEYQAVDVRVTTGATGYLVQTALATVVTDDSGQKVAVLAISRDISPAGPWRVRVLREEQQPTPQGGKCRLGLDVPQARPGGHAAIEYGRRLVNANDRNAACEFKEGLADVALWGPGPRGFVDGGKDSRVYHDLVVVDPGNDAAGTVVSVPAGTCVDLGDPEAVTTDVGRGPAGITVTSKLRDDARILVSNRLDGTVSIIGLDEMGTASRTIPLGAGACPEDIGAGMEKARSWVIDDLLFAVGPDGTDPHLEWSAGPMEQGTVYRVYEAPMTDGKGIRDGEGVTPPKPTGPWIPLGQTIDHRWPLDLAPESRAYLVEILE